MKQSYTQTPYARRWLKLAGTVSVALVATSCGNEPASPVISAPIDAELSTQTVSSPTIPILSLPAEPSLPTVPLSNGLQYPMDEDKDDRPGLIVEGFKGEDLQTVASEFLLSTSTFRLDKKTPGSGDGYVHMVVYDESKPVAAHLDFYQPPLNSCLIRHAEEAQTVLDHSSNMAASGGASVVINTPSGPWFTFAQRQIETDQFLYQVDNQIPGAFPEGTTLSVPGDLFPTVASYPIYEPEAPVRLLPIQGEEVTAISEFSWVAGPASGYIKINLLAYDASDDFQGFSVSCWAEDNGRFVLPEVVLDYISNSQLTHRVRFSRVYARLDWSNGIAIHQSVEVAE